MTLDIPAFLKIPQADRATAWEGRKLTRQGSNFRHKPTKVEEAATRQLRRELEAAEKAKRETRFAMLRELNEQKRRAK
jgi:hypothetical protein